MAVDQSSFSVGDNTKKGEVANIGGTNGFMNLSGGSYKASDVKKLEYFILSPTITPKSDHPQFPNPFK